MRWASVESRTTNQGRAALVIAHPGHELRVHHWLEQARPVVFVLTDGSGRNDASRLQSTSGLLEATGSRIGSTYGRWTDRAIYQAIQTADAAAFIEIVRELATTFSHDAIDYVVADSMEGYNPAHDLCRIIADAAVLLTELEQKRPLRSYEFLLAGRPDAVPEASRELAIRVQLDDEALQRKITAANSYAELKSEVDAAVRQSGTAIFATEWLIPTDPFADLDKFERSSPYYERYGEQQVAAGHYDEVIRYAEHVKPLATSIWEQLRLPTSPATRGY
jgi:hypothetical protein